MKKFIRKILGIEEDAREFQHRISTIENMIFDKQSMLNGYAVLSQELVKSVFAIDNGRTLCKSCHLTTDTIGRRKKDVN